MRTLEEGKCFHREDMFHIPFNKRGFVSTQRYSMPGLPCLYLGYSLHACWEEMHRKPISTFAFNRFHLQKDIKVLSLDLPDKSRWGTDHEKVIQIFPLIIACMVEVDNYTNSFKSEYIIPQLLMEWITNHPKVEVDGICYTSVHKNSQFNFPQSVYNNLALPAKDYESGKFSKHLKEMFTLTEPTTEEVERVKVGAFENIYTIYENVEDQLKENYRVSLFGSLESILCENYKLGTI